MPTPTISNIVVANATAYSAPKNEPMPANTVALGAAWGGNWTYTGGQDDGGPLTFNFTQNVTRHMIEEQSMPAAITVDTSDPSVTMTLAEDTLENMKLAFGSGGTLTVNAGASPPNKVLVTADIITVIAFGFEALNLFGKARRVYFSQAVVYAAAQTPYRRSAQKRAYAITIASLVQPTITEMTG
jgi:hypothetical protein